MVEGCYRKLDHVNAAGKMVKIRKGGSVQGSQPVPVSVHQVCLYLLGKVGVWPGLKPGEFLGICSKKHGIRAAGGFACKCCNGFWKESKGSSRVVQLMDRSAGKQLSLQLILDKPSEKLWQK